MKNINRFNRTVEKIKTRLFYARKFKKLGKKSIIFAPMQIDNPEMISVGDNVFIAHNAWLMTVKNDIDINGLLIGNCTVIGHNAHIVANNSVTIGESVLIADKVFISDCTHEYIDADIPVMSQPVRTLKPVSIGDETWIGENVCVCGANIGKHCVIGANSVVTSDIPDYSVAAGAPAKIIKHYDSESGEWVKVCK